jgi:hypothetical protein
MFPQNTVIFFVQADSVGNGQDVTITRGHVRVKECRHTSAITTTAQCVRVVADTFLTDVKSVLAEVRRERGSVGHNHFSERETVENRTQTTFIVPANVVEHNTFTRIETNTELPVVPVDEIARDLR